MLSNHGKKIAVERMKHEIEMYDIFPYEGKRKKLLIQMADLAALINKESMYQLQSKFEYGAKYTTNLYNTDIIESLNNQIEELGDF